MRTDDLEHGKKAFQISSQRKIKSGVLFDTEKNEVVLVAIEGEPIHLVNVIEFAREYANVTSSINMAGGKAGGSILIGEIVKAMAGEPILFVGGAGIAHVLGPYYVFKGDGANATGAAASLAGGIYGAIVGTMAAGPVGGIIGGIVGGVVGGAGAKGMVKAFTHSRQCKTCQGIGLVDDLRRCSECKGYGYHK